MTDEEILAELGTLPQNQQEMTKRIWQLAESMRVCWICGDDEADVRHLNASRGYFCPDCYSIQMGSL